MTEHRTPTPPPTASPHAWRDELVLALRVRDVTGTRIGDVAGGGRGVLRGQRSGRPDRLR